MASRADIGAADPGHAARNPVRRALLSVSDKSGIVLLAQRLAASGVELLSTGGTAGLLRAAGLAVRDIADYIGFPEIMDGRVKTLHPRVHGGLLGRRGIDDAVMREHGIAAIDLLVINLYPFVATLAQPDVTYDQAVENIDIGGPAMLRAAAKNHAHVGVLVDPVDYEAALEEIAAGGLTFGLRQRLAARAFAHIARYDAMVAGWMQRQCGAGPEFPDRLGLEFTKRLDLRYGENPHQRAALYVDPDARGACVGGARQLHGKDLSFNNLADADTAFECVRQFDTPACVIVKHANPCGVALANSAHEAYERAYTTDPTSAFGGVIAFNRELDAATAAAIVVKQFVEVIVAPTVAADALRALAAKPNVRVLAAGELAEGTPATPDLRGIAGGLLVQDRDGGMIGPAALRVVTKRAPTPAEFDDLMFAWRVCKFVKSNAIVYARDAMTLGVGAGQMSRVVSSKIAAMKASEEGLEVDGAVLASDAFFPFRDGLDVAAGFGIRAVIQPGGSIRDGEVVAAADEHGMAMVFTGMRHFRH